jgi:hypothetical protein
MASEEPATVLCHYRVRSGQEEALWKLIEAHDTAVRRLGFVTEAPTVVYRGRDDEGRPFFVKVFDWSPGGVEQAHQHPEVLAVWERMEPLCEARDGRPAMEFPHVERVVLPT